MTFVHDRAGYPTVLAVKPSSQASESGPPRRPRSPNQQEERSRPANPRSVRKVASLALVIAIVGALAPQSGGTPNAAQSCDRQSVASLVRSFVRAYNKGNTNQLESMWATEPDFEWYSVSPNERERNDAYDRETLIPYFEKRHKLGDQLRLKTMRIRPADDRGIFGINYRLRRQSDQQAGGGRYHGKASVKQVMALPSVNNLSLSRCVLFVWSMGKQ